MKQKDNDRVQRLFSALGDLDPATVESARRYRPVRHASPHLVRRIVAVALASVLMLALITLTVFAAVPSLRSIINMPFLNENAQKDKVPEGWVGIYTVADLDAVRDDLNGKYILMNDLTFADGETFTPIGTQETPFMGQFDGNGYVIRNLTIDVTQPAPPIEEGSYSTWEGTTAVFYHKITHMSFVGLFGFCGHSQLNANNNIDSTINDYAFPYLTDEQHYRGMICNLGVEGATVKVSDASNVRVGVIAGQGSYVVGCYVEDCTIELTAYEASTENAHFRLRMGGIAGNAQVLDSCYATGCRLSVTGANELLSDHMNIDGMNTFEKATVFLGGLAGNAYAMVTSYVEDNEITCDYAADRQREEWHHDCPAYVGELYGHVHRIPTVMNYSHFQKFFESYYRALYGLSDSEPIPEDWYKSDGSHSLNDDPADFYFHKFRSYYFQKSLDEMVKYFDIDPNHVNPALVTGDFAVETNMYVFDRAALMEEMIYLEDLAMEYMGTEKLAEAVALDNLKVGPIYCPVLDPDATYNQEDFTEFNFKTVWKMKDGRPVLRIFE